MYLVMSCPVVASPAIEESDRPVLEFRDEFELDDTDAAVWGQSHQGKGLREIRSVYACVCHESIGFFTAGFEDVSSTSYVSIQSPLLEWSR